jgi:hypothetical protein
MPCSLSTVAFSKASNLPCDNNGHDQNSVNYQHVQTEPYTVRYAILFCRSIRESPINASSERRCQERDTLTVLDVRSVHAAKARLEVEFAAPAPWAKLSF